MSATVPALIPLSLLEAIRNLDTPLEEIDTFVNAMRNVLKNGLPA